MGCSRASVIYLATHPLSNLVPHKLHVHKYIILFHCKYVYICILYRTGTCTCVLVQPLYNLCVQYFLCSVLASMNSLNRINVIFMYMVIYGRYTVHVDFQFLKALSMFISCTVTSCLYCYIVKRHAIVNAFTASYPSHHLAWSSPVP